MYEGGYAVNPRKAVDIYTRLTSVVDYFVIFCFLFIYFCLV